MSRFRSLRWRLVGWYVVLLAGVLLLFSGGVYLAVQRLLIESFDEVLEHQAELVAQAIDVEDGAPVFAREILLPDLSDNEHFTRLYRTDQTLSSNDMAVAEQVPELPAAVANALQGQRSLMQIQLRTGALRIATFPVVHKGSIAGALQVGVALNDIDDTLRTLLQVLLGLAPATLLAASGGGVFLANRALAPIDQITRTAQRISAENLSGRIGMQGPDDEVGRLARTFDSMLAGLEAAFARQRQFTADASHELRTPLTAIIGQIDVAIGWPESAESYRATLLAVREQAHRLARLANDLLLLARADAHPTTRAIELIDLGNLLPAIITQVEPLAAARNQTMTIAPFPPLRVQGNEDQLIRLLMNLLDNAIRYTPPTGNITLACTSDHESIVLRVSDTGPGIAPEHVPRLFDRFYRAERGRSRAQGGSGLGLAIAQSIAQAHGGRITVESIVGQGSTFAVRLPKIHPVSPRERAGIPAVPRNQLASPRS